MRKAQIPDIEKKVGYILEMYPHTRNSDGDLIAVYYREFFGVTTLEQMTAIKLSFASLIRYRRKYQQNGKYLSSKETERMRAELEKIIRREISAETILDIAHNKKLRKAGKI